MEEDALVSDPVANSAEAQAAILAQSQPFDEGQFPPKGQTLPDGQPFVEGQTLTESQVCAEVKPLDESESSKIVMSTSEELVFEYLCV